MRNRDRVIALSSIVLLVLVVRLSEQLYRWWAFAEERAAIAQLDEELRRVAVGVISTQLRADTLRKSIERVDSELAAGRGEVDLYEGRAGREDLGDSLEGVYREVVGRYNQMIEERNELFSTWQEVVDENHRYVDRYNLLADSIRTLAASMGEPYYPIRSPAEMIEQARSSDVGSTIP